MDEHKELEIARDGFLGAEKRLRRAIEALDNIKDINTHEGRHEAANAAFCIMALAQAALGGVQHAHGQGTKELFAFWPEEAVPHEEGGVIRSGHR